MKNIKIIRLVILFFAIVILSGCAPRPVFQLSSLEEEVEYSEGREVVIKEDEKAVTWIEFEEQAGNEFVVYVVAANESDSELEISPEKISVEVFTSNKTVSNNDKGIKYYAIDPEIQINSLREAMAQRETDHSVSTGLNCFAGILNIFADVANEEEEEVPYDIADWAGTQTEEEIDYSNTMEALNADLEFWKNEVLRKTTLHPGEEIGGLVFLPENDDGKIVKVVIPIGNTVHSYRFKQIKIN